MVYQWIWSYLKKYISRVPFGLFLALIVALLNMVNPYISGMIKNASWIFFLDQGRIIEAGSHNELMKKKGAYFKLYQSQYCF